MLNPYKCAFFCFKIGIKQKISQYISITVLYAVGVICLPERSAFLRGSIILICANAAAKILGAVFKIPLTYVLCEEGMAVYQTAFSVYIMMLSLVPGGFGFATTKLLGEYCAVGKGRRSSAVVKGMTLVLGIFGIFVSAAMYIWADLLALAMREAAAPDSIRAIAFAVLVVSISSPVKSFNEADAHYIPTALSQVIEAAIKLVLGLYFAKLFKNNGSSPAVGALLGVVAGETFQTLFLYAVWLLWGKNVPHAFMKKEEFRKIFKLALPLTVTGLATGALAMCETAVIRNALSDITFSKASAYAFLKNYAPYTDVFNTLPTELCLNPDGVRKLFGAFSGYAQTVFNLPVGIAATVTAAATPLFSRSITLGSGCDIERTAEKVLKPVYFIIAPATLVCTFFPGEVLNLIFNNRFAAGMLASCAPAMLFLCASNMLVLILHLSGRVYEPFAAAMLSLLVRIVATAILVRIPGVNILGAGYAQIIASACMLICTLAMSGKMPGIKTGLLKSAARPFISGCVMVAVMKIAAVFIPSCLGGRISFLIVCLIGGGVYGMLNYNLSLRSKL